MSDNAESVFILLLFTDPKFLPLLNLKSNQNFNKHKNLHFSIRDLQREIEKNYSKLLIFYRNIYTHY